MPFTVTCPACASRLKAKEAMIGRTLPCPKCRHTIEIKAPEEEPSYTFRDEPAPPPVKLPPVEDSDDEPISAEVVDDDAESPPAKKRAKPASGDVPVVSGWDQPEAEAAPPRKKRKDTAPALPPLSAAEPPLWLRHLHWLLVLAMLPLALSLLSRSEAMDLEARLLETLENLSEEEGERIGALMADVDEETSPRVALEKLFAGLPRQRLHGAFLPRNTWAHWLFAVGAAVLFMSFFVLLSTHQVAEPLHVLAVGLFTATVGIFFLLFVQILAMASQGVWLRGGGIVALLLLIVKLIGYSYQAAIDPQNGFFLSFLGYTFGVGLCEEVVKAAPLLWLYKRGTQQSWRGAFVWGLASGAGFGIAEGIMYSSNYYNGITGPGIYVVRFISCVALHALWTGSVGITLHQWQGLLHGADHWFEYIPRVLLIVAVPMVLHGLYDTLLKKDYHAWALAVAALSFLYLAFLISRLHTAHDADATDDMLREYQRRKALS